MGTSTDYDGGTGGDWTSLKTASTGLAKKVGKGDIDRTSANRVFSRHVSILGGPAGAASSARSARAGFAQLADFLADVSDSGFEAALDARNLAHLIGQDRFDVLDELATALAGTGSDLEAQAARDAQFDVLEDLFGEAQTWEELEETSLTREGLIALLTSFLARYVYNRIPTLAIRLAKLLDPVQAAGASKEFIRWLKDAVQIQLPPDPISFDWQGPQAGICRASGARRVHDHRVLGGSRCLKSKSP